MCVLDRRDGTRKHSAGAGDSATLNRGLDEPRERERKGEGGREELWCVGRPGLRLLITTSGSHGLNAACGLQRDANRVMTCFLPLYIIESQQSAPPLDVSSGAAGRTPMDDQYANDHPQGAELNRESDHPQLGLEGG